MKLDGYAWLKSAWSNLHTPKGEVPGRTPRSSQDVGVLSLPAKEGNGTQAEPEDKSGDTAGLLSSDQNGSQHAQLIKNHAAAKPPETDVKDSWLDFRPLEPLRIGEPEVDQNALASPLERQALSDLRLASPNRMFTPQVNTSLSSAAPGGDTSTHSQHRNRVQELLKKHGFFEKVVRGDGNCQFRALAYTLSHDEDQHGQVRADVVRQLHRFKEYYSQFVAEDYDGYCEQMSRDGEWGDHVTLQAAADLYFKQISLITSYTVEPYIEVRPITSSPMRPLHILWLSFVAELHYNAIEVPDNDLCA